MVLSNFGNGECGWGLLVGETRSGVCWKVTTNGNSVVLDEDMKNWPTDDVQFSGSLNGAQFTATDSTA
jgi:hypothetical protein